MIRKPRKSQFAGGRRDFHLLEEGLFLEEMLDIEEVELKEFLVTMVDQEGGRNVRMVLAEGDRLALVASESLFRGERAVAVYGIPLIGRCVRCRAVLLRGDWHQRLSAGLVCESCPLGFSIQFPVRRRRRRERV